MPYWAIASSILRTLIQSPITRELARHAIRLGTASLVRHIRNSSREKFPSSTRRIS